MLNIIIAFLTVIIAKKPCFVNKIAAKFPFLCQVTKIAKKAPRAR